MRRPGPRAWHKAEHLFVVAALLALAFTMLGRAAAKLPEGGPLDQRIERSVHDALPPFAASVLEVVSFFGSTIFIGVGVLGG
ncbi:MAG TPA: hypothetical protein VG777_09175, partial [Thermoanaerobaculia bacterium]|nr:hypothetical protein [Thermoanaerobaculia bacterium]